MLCELLLRGCRRCCCPLLVPQPTSESPFRDRSKISIDPYPLRLGPRLHASLRNASRKHAFRGGAPMSAVVSVAEARRSRVRLFIVTMLFLVTTVNYADRATLSIAGPALSKELHLDPIAMGYIFSAFGWSYVVAQVPGGWLLDRYGSRWVYAFSIIVWSLFTTMQG